MRDAPLRETLILVGLMLLLAWPLWSLTRRQGERVQVVPEESTSLLVRTDVEVEWSGKLEWLELLRGEEVLGRLEDGDDELEIEVNPAGEKFTLRGSFSGEERQAVRVEFLPDFHDEREVTVWGEGDFAELLEIKWHE